MEDDTNDFLINNPPGVCTMPRLMARQRVQSLGKERSRRQNYTSNAHIYEEHMRDSRNHPVRRSRVAEADFAVHVHARVPFPLLDTKTSGDPTREYSLKGE
jgi:hypothetical protein